MPELITVPGDLKIAVNARQLQILLEIAARAPMKPAEEEWLQMMSSDIVARAQNQMEQQRARAEQEAEDKSPKDKP